MLQRAASNAYSWWVASHIRTKQSKWLEQNLQDMEEKVAAVVKLISEDGDSFAKKAEMYYKKRPELLQFVEDSFRAYRALAERYDHISKELQNANSTLASAFPDQFQYAMDDDEEGPPKPRKGVAHSGQNPAQKPNIPEAPKQFPTKNIKAIIAISSKANSHGQEPQKKQGKKPGNKAVEALRAGFDKNQAVDEIDRLQKHILTKQTEKEFTKSSYESGVAKYWQIEKEITEMQEKVSTLQDAFGVGKAIEDNEARTLMLEAALRSCQEKLAELQEKQEKSAAEAKEERRKIRSARDKIMSFKGEILGSEQSNQSEKRSDYRRSEAIWAKYDNDAELSSEAKELEMLRDKMKETFDGAGSLSVSEMVDKIDELVNKVIKMESTLCSQTAMIQTLKTEDNELQTHIQSLEEEKKNPNVRKDSLKDKLREMDQKLKGIRELGDSVDRRNSKLQTQFSEASGNLGLISQKLPDLKLDEEIEESEVKETESESVEIQERSNVEESREKVPARETEQEEREHNRQADETPKTKPEDTKKGELEEKEKALMNEYTEVLENYKKIQKKLGEVESKSEESLTELHELRKAVARKDEEIQSLRQKLTHLQQKLEEYRNRDESNKPPQEPTPRSQNDNNGDEEEEEEEDLAMPDEPAVTSPVEVKLRADLDEILQENLNFWIRFSASYSAMQKFHHEVEDLQLDLAKIEEKKKNDMSTDHKSDFRAIYKHLKEIQTDISVWVEQSMKLKSELQGRFSQLCHIKEEITRVLNENALDDQMRFTSLEAARFKGEVMNMQQENNRVEEELENSLSNMASLQSEVEGIISKLNEELGIVVSRKQTTGQVVPANKNQVPLRSFIFANKQQKKKNSILACVHPTLQKKYQQLKS